MRRVLWITVGVAAAALAVRGLGLWAAHEGRTGISAEALDQPSVGQRIGDFLAQVREAAAEREVELRAGLGLDGRHDAVDAPTAGNRSVDPGAVRENQ